MPPRMSPRMLCSTSRLAFTVTAATVTVLFSATPSIAGDRSPLSTLRIMPATHERAEPETYGVPGLVIKENNSGSRPFLELTAAKAQGYCIVDRDGSLAFQSSTTWSAYEKVDQKDLWRLVEKDDKATLEQTRVTIDESRKSAWARRKSSVELRAVARASGVTVWGYREKTGDVVLVARGVSSGRELGMDPENGNFGFVSSDCAWGAVRLFASATRTGTIAQLRGSLPPVSDGKTKTVPQFVVNGSVAKLSRDPEPLLDVRIRMID